MKLEEYKVELIKKIIATDDLKVLKALKLAFSTVNASQVIATSFESLLSKVTASKEAFDAGKIYTHQEVCKEILGKEGQNKENLLWTEAAYKDLLDIKKNVSTLQATKAMGERRVPRIMEKISALENEFLRLGEKETIPELKEQYLYTLQDNYKIVYRVLKDNVVIDAIIHTATQPNKSAN